MARWPSTDSRACVALPITPTPNGRSSPNSSTRPRLLDSAILVSNRMTTNDYDAVELRGGRFHKLRRADARRLGDDDGMVPVAKCYCRSHDIVTAADADLQRRPTFVFPAAFFA